MIHSCKKPPVYFPTVTGSICSFRSQYADLPLKSHTIALTATESGSGTPSPDNVRPISGYSAINIANASEDLYHDITVQNGYLDTYGNIQASGVSSVTDYIPVVEGLVYYYYDYATAALGPRNICIYDDSKQFVSYIAYETVNKKVYFSIPSTGAYVRITIDRNYTNQHLYNGTTTTIQIGSTVYGGEYDAKTGVFTVTHGISTFKGLNEEGWNISGEGTSRRFRIELNGSNNTQSISDRFSWVSSNSGVWGKFRIASNQLLLLDNTSVMTDVSALKTWLSNNNASFVYPLAEPFDIPLGGINLLAQEGQNNIFADCGDTTLEYLKAGR